MQSIELTAESKKCFCYFYLVPHLKALAKECESASYNCEAEELLGKSKENLRKVKTISPPTLPSSMCTTSGPTR